MVKVAPLVVAIIAFIGLLFTIHNFIHNTDTENDNSDKGNGDANLTNRRPEKLSFFSSLASKEMVTDDGGTVINGAFAEGGGGMGFISRKKGDVISFPLGKLTNMEAGTVELCVTLKQKFADEEDYYLFFVEDKNEAVILQIAWHETDDKDSTKGYHNVRLRVKPGDNSGIKGNARVHSPKIDWQPGEYHHIAATWGAAGLYVYIDGKIEIKELCEDNVEGGRENLGTLFVINNAHHDPVDADRPTHCVVSNFRISNYQKSDAQVKESYATLHPNRSSK